MNYANRKCMIVIITLKIVNRTLNLFIYLATIHFLISKKTTKFTECQFPGDKNLRDCLVWESQLLGIILGKSNNQHPHSTLIKIIPSGERSDVTFLLAFFFPKAS